MDTPDKNRISAVSFCNFEDSPVFQYINDLSPIEPVKPAGPENNILHSLALTSPSSLFSSPQINSYRDSRFSIKRHRSLDLSSPLVLIDETVKNSPDALEAVKISDLCEEKLKCRPEQLRIVSETKPFKEQINLAIELANSFNNTRDGCDIQMVSCDQVTTVAENELGRGGLREQSDQLCRQFNDPLDSEADSDGVLQSEEMEAESGFAGEEITFHVAGEQHIPRIANPRFDSFASEPQQFSLSRNNTGNVEEPGGSCSVQVAAGVPDITLSSLSNVAAFGSSDKAEDKEETGHQPFRKQRSVRMRCLNFDMGGSYKRIPLRDSTNDLPLHFTSVNKSPSPQKCLDTSKQDADEILSIPQTIGLHLNSLVNPSVSIDQNKSIFKDGRVFPHGPTTFRHNTEDVFSTPVSTKRDLVTCDTKILEAPERSMEGECFDKHMPAENRQLSHGLDELGNCKRCRCRKSKCLKLYCECFAAGLYCIEPCNCQNCFNKPIHEDIVVKTREQIEVRNPLAFAPKVVSSTGSAIDIWDENSKTPASARHTRGCNCRKSGCSKKYCDCYMMGVGCSSSCRCIGCKNIYGDTNKQCDGESDAVTINDEAKDNGDHGYASSRNEETSNSERRNRMLLPSSGAFRSLASL